MFKQTKLFKDRPKATLWLDRYFWSLEVWPLHFLILIIFLHASVLVCITDVQEPAFNRGFGSVLQIIGASVVLWCITQNLALLKGKNIIEVIKQSYKEYKKRWPTGIQKGHNITVTHDLCAVVNVATNQEQNQFNSIDEKLDYLFKRTIELEEKLNSTRNALNSRIYEVETELKQVKKSFQFDVDNLKETLNHAVLDGIMWEIFGCFAALYGVFISGFLG